MYRKSCKQILMPDDFFLPFGGKLNKDNRWVKYAMIIPWWKFEDRYASKLKSLKRGEKAYTVRMALGALIIQTRFEYSDEELPLQIMENPYLQYFLGYEGFNDNEPPFHPSLIVHFRKRLNKDILAEVNELLAVEAAKEAMPKKKRKKKDDDNSNPPGGSQAADHASSQEVPSERRSKLRFSAFGCNLCSERYPVSNGFEASQ